MWVRGLLRLTPLISIIREPRAGVDYVLPVGLDTMMPVTGYRTVIDALIALYELDGARLGHATGR